MAEGIRGASARHVTDVRGVARELTEKALRMRCLGYLAQVKAGLLTETIFEVDRSRRKLRTSVAELENQRRSTAGRAAALEEANRKLRELHRELERLVGERTAELEDAYASLERRCAQQVAAEQENVVLADQLRQNQKMEALGLLAGGVAHDFNNLLTAMFASTSFLRTAVFGDDAGPGSAADHDQQFGDVDVAAVQDELDTLEYCAKRAAALTRQLLVFSRRQAVSPELIAVGQALDNTDKMLRRLLPEDIELTLRRGANLSPILADPGHFEQVIVNLTINARDAMPQGGTLTLETAEVVLDAIYTEDHAAIRPGRYVRLAITDTGCGMDAQTVQHIFEPFFTTKAAGAGTGLGLATVHGIVKQVGGQIVVYSEPGSGTTIKVYWPAVADGEPSARQVEALSVAGGDEKVLVCDDDSSLRRLVCATLEGRGYDVLAAESGRQAHELTAELGQPVDLLVTDVIMPDENGYVLARRLGERWPSLKVLFMSGYAAGALVRRGVLDEGAAFLEKPFGPNALLARVRDALDG